MRSFWRFLRMSGLAAALLAGTSCYTYEIPQQEIARISKEIEKGRLEKVELENLFPKDYKFPKLYDYFFYTLYHLENSGKDYVVDRKDLETFFEKHELSSFVPFSEIEKIVREDGKIKMYNGRFTETIPGASMIYLSASENVHFDSSQEYRIHLRPVQGTLELRPKFLMRFFGYSFRSEIQEIQLYDKGTNVLFKCKINIGNKTTYWDVIYHSKDGTSSQCESDPQEIVGR
ncbi:MAG: hypothetical protein KAT43_04940 [Nanoarchaeota archaeon]|nr:hypothetical protein [Nanoarchaeota archaeon]